MIYIYANKEKYKHDIFEVVREISSINDITFITKLSELENISDFEMKISLEDKHDYILGTLYYKNHKYDCKTKFNKSYEKYLGEKTVYNNTFKRAVLDLFKNINNEFIKWGILTGIRPMKIIHNLLDCNLNYSDIKLVLQKEYYLSERAIEDMIEISKIQRKYVNVLDNNRISLYLNIPFCPTKCSYCSFSSFAIKDYKIVEDYINTLLYEIEETAKICAGKKINTLYIGGGTPTAIKKEDLSLIIKHVFKHFNIDENSLNEFTVEAGRPDTISKDYLITLKELGVNRISINPQTMNDKTLERIKRGHDKNLIIKAYNVAKDIQFDIINMDVILGLPGENLIDIKNTIEEVTKMSPENLTLHSLALKRGSLLSNNDYDNQSGGINQIELNSVINHYVQTSNLHPYYLYRQKQSFLNSENIGYCKPGKESIYNIVMMEERETIIGLGLGAVSKVVNAQDKSVTRIPNYKGLNEYNNKVEDLLTKKKKVVSKLK